MKLSTALVLLATLTSVHVATAASIDDPGKATTETSKPKVQKSKKLRAPLFGRRKSKETDFAKSMRRNEVLRSSASPAATE